MTQENASYPLSLSKELGSRFSVALFEPCIPLNVGSIARTCACTGFPLHIVGTTGFILDDKLAKRAGLDYWELAEVYIHRTWEEFEETMAGRTLWLFSTKGTKTFWEADYWEGDVLVFGPENAGLPDAILGARSDSVVRVPMVDGLRSLNLANVVSVAIYDVVRKCYSMKGHVNS